MYTQASLDFNIIYSLSIIKDCPCFITEKFGSQKIDDEVIQRFEKVTGKKGMATVSFCKNFI